MENLVPNISEKIEESLVIEVKDFNKIQPKFTKAKWESGEGGGQDSGESPADN